MANGRGGGGKGAAATLMSWGFGSSAGYGEERAAEGNQVPLEAVVMPAAVEEEAAAAAAAEVEVEL